MRTNFLKVFIAAWLGPIVLAGCVKTWMGGPPGTTEYSFKLDQAHCNAVANGAAPPPNTAYIPTHQQHQGVIYTSRGMATYSGTTYDAGAAGANLGNAIAGAISAAVRDDIFNACMKHKGYYLQGESRFELIGDPTEQWSCGESLPPNLRQQVKGCVSSNR